MGIGPELPPHLARPRSPSPSSPRAAGPALPAPSAAAADRDSDSDSNSDDFGPSLPPELVQERKARPNVVTGPQFPSARAVGPQLPPHLQAAKDVRSPSASRPAHRHHHDHDDDDDAEDVGPMPLPAGAGGAGSSTEDGARAFREREARAQEKERAEKEQDRRPKREEWMLVPPKEMDLMSSIDTTKLKSRGFATGKAAQTAANKSGPSNLWTETPAERQQRLQDEALGRKRKAENAPVQEEESDEARRKRIRDQQLKAEVERHNTSRRSESLVDQHTRDRKAKPKADDDGRAPTNIWDRERDMGVGGRLMDDSQRSSIIKNAKDLGGRFGGGSFL